MSPETEARILVEHAALYGTGVGHHGVTIRRVADGFDVEHSAGTTWCWDAADARRTVERALAAARSPSTYELVQEDLAIEHLAELEVPR